MSFWAKIRSFFTDGLFPETRRRNEQREESNIEGLPQIPQKGWYLKPGPIYRAALKDLLGESVGASMSSRPCILGQGSALGGLLKKQTTVWKKFDGKLSIPKLNPVNRTIEFVTVTEHEADSVGEDFWMVADVITDENGQFKFQFIGPSGMGWTNWMDIDEFSNAFEKMS